MLKVIITHRNMAKMVRPIRGMGLLLFIIYLSSLWKYSAIQHTSRIVNPTTKITATKASSCPYMMLPYPGVMGEAECLPRLVWLRFVNLNDGSVEPSHDAQKTSADKLDIALRRAVLQKTV